MSNNNHNDSSSCAHAGQMVSYLYGEADAGGKYEFETHLENCPTCADELAAFGLVRSTVLDWRAEEFSKLPTPTFNIPTAEFKESFSTASVSNDKHSWLAGFRRMFSFNLTKATAAFGIALVCAGVIWFAFNSSGGDEIADKGDGKNKIQAAVSPTVETAKKSEENVADARDKSSPPSSDVTDSTPPMKREKPDSPNKSIVKVSGNAAKNNSDNSARNPKQTNESGKKTAPVRKKQIPNLDDAEDEEDETIRLADLFDELDAK